jgi:hypothetical protein
VLLRGVLGLLLTVTDLVGDDGIDRGLLGDRVPLELARRDSAANATGRDGDRGDVPRRSPR